MNLSHALMTRLSDAANRLNAGVHETFAPRARAEAYDRMREALIPALDQFVAALTKSGRALTNATAPYIDQMAAGARNSAEALQDNTIAGAQAIGAALQKRRGTLARHPYLIATLVIGAGYMAYRSVSRRVSVSVERPRTAARKAAGGTRARANRGNARGNARTQRERRQRAVGTAAATDNTKAIH